MAYRYYAFVDLLGYRELIERDLASGEQQLKEKLTAAFDSALQGVNEADINVKAISDSIFVSLSNDALGFEFIARVLQNLQYRFLENGLLVRGGVSFAEHFENGKVTYSPALVEAYSLESKLAFFPRILIHNAVIEKLRNAHQLDDILGKNLIVSHANNYQIHFLSDSNWISCVKQLRKLATEQYDVLVRDPSIYAKHWYLEDYVARFRPKGERLVRYMPSWQK